MFYLIDDEITTIEKENINKYDLIVGLIRPQELEQVATLFNFDKKAVIECDNSNNNFNQIIENYDDYIFMNLKILDYKNYDKFSVFVADNIFIIVDLCTDSEKVRNIFMNFLGKIKGCNISIEKIIFLFFDSLIDCTSPIEYYQNKIASMEQCVENSETKSDFNLDLLDIKNTLIDVRNYYEFIIDVAQIMGDNYNDLFQKKNLKYFKCIEKKAQRLKENIDVLRDNVVHLREAYQSILELKLNSTMKLLTVFTVLFSPLSLITGWFGMNFFNMPLVSYRYGYLFVIMICAFIVIMLLILFKKKKLI